MWNTFTAGLQMVQEKLDTVLDEPLTNQDQDEHDGGPPDPVSDESYDNQVIITAEHPPSPTKIEEPAKIEELPKEVSIVDTDWLLRQVSSLQQALDESEKQTQLINLEYKKLLAEKENEIVTLKESLNPASDNQATPQSTDHTPSHEILLKELAAHKEMVTELRSQLEEKEAEFEELNAKAENKFNKLRAQAKNKISSLNHEMERLKQERDGNDSLQSSLNVSAFDNSFNLSPSTSTEHAQFKPELSEKEKELEKSEEELASLREEISQRKRDGEKYLIEMVALRDKLNVSEVCLQKEQESRVSMELRVTELEEHLDQVTSDLRLVQKEREKLQDDLKKEKTENESPADKEMCSSGTQSPYNRGGESRDNLSPSVLAAGDRGSLIDMESEISQMEATIRERDQQLSSFKSVLEEKESLLQKQSKKETELSSELETLHSQCETRDSDIEKLQTELSASIQSAQEARAHLEEKITELESKEEEQKLSVDEKSSRISQLEGAIQEAKLTRERLEQEIISKSDAIENLSDSIATQKQLLKEKEDVVSEKISNIHELELSVQKSEMLHESLRLSVNSNEQETSQKLVSYLDKIQELDGAVLELRNKLEDEELVVEEVNSTNQLLEEKLKVAQESLLQKEETQGEMEMLQKSVTKQKEDSNQQIEELRKELELQCKKLQAVTVEREEARNGLTQAQGSLAKSEDTLKQLNLKMESVSSQSSEFQLQVSKLSGALEFAQGELASRDSTIKSLSGALEDSKAALAKAESQMAQQKSELADKITEAVQRSEKSMESKSVLESELRSARLQLQAMDAELRQAQGQLDEVTKDRSGIQTALNEALSKLSNLERAKEMSLVENETLRGQVESLSESRSTLSLEHKESVTELNSKLSQSSTQIQDLQQKLQIAKKKLSKAIAEKDKESARREEMEADLTSHKRENRQMKEQFESAVKLMEVKLSEQGTAMARMSKEMDQKESVVTSLKEQLLLESQKGSEMKEKVVRTSADYKVSADRCRVLEREKAELEQALMDRTSKHNHLEHVYSESLSEKERLQLEHQASLNGIQEHEARVLSLSDQLAQVARDKQALEGQLHEVTRQLLSSEQGKLNVTSELERHREALRDSKNWWREKQDLINEKAVLEKAKSMLQAGETNMLSKIAVLEASLTQLQEELRQSHAELDTTKNSIKNGSQNDELQKRISDLQQSHSSEIIHLQHVHSTELTSIKRSFQEEKEKREAAERLLLAQGEVSISMEDVQPFASVGNGVDAPSTLVDYVNIALIWIQRLVKNPNIVLTRLVRVAPHTRLFFLAYFIFLHLMILYILIV